MQLCSNKKYFLYIINNELYNDFNIVPFTYVYIRAVTASQTMSLRKPATTSERICRKYNLLL